METKKIMKPETIKAWHFVGKTLRDGSPIPRNGQWLKFDGPVKICHTGLHASLHPFDALQYAQGNTLCLVECRDIIERHDDKFVCREQRIIKRMDAAEIYAEAYATARAAARAAEYGTVLSLTSTNYAAARAADLYGTVYAAARDKFRELVYDCFADYL